MGAVGGRNFGLPIDFAHSYTTACCYRTSRDAIMDWGVSIFNVWLAKLVPNTCLLIFYAELLTTVTSDAGAF